MENKYISNERFKNHFDSDFNAEMFKEVVGEKIKEWIEDGFTFENGLKRKPDNDDFYLFDCEDLEYMLTARGDEIYDRYLLRINNLAKKLFPEERYWYFDTGVYEF